MKILFILKQLGYIRHFDRVIAQLVDHGHHVTIGSQDGVREIPQSIAGYSGVSVVSCPKKRGDSWREHASLLRRSSDYLRYLEPKYAKAGKLRARAFSKLIHTLSQGTREPNEGWSEAATSLSRLELRRLREFFRLMEDELPSDPDIRLFISDQDPDVILISPLVDIGSGQTEFVTAARALEIPVAMVLFSWDNLSTKGTIHAVPDRVYVWNQLQKKEAIELHGVPDGRIRITGASRFDRFFELAPVTTRTELFEPLGLDPSRPLVTYLCSSRFVAAGERQFLDRWIRAIRTCSDQNLRECNILIKSHPDLNKEWADAGEQNFRWNAVGNAVVTKPFDDARITVVRSKFTAEQFLYECLYHASAVVGLNTSAEIESAIVGRPVYTMMVPEDLADGQTGTLHFYYLLRPHGGFVEVAHDFDEHCRQIALGLAGHYDKDRIKTFVREFLRPRGPRKPAANWLVGDIEKKWSKDLERSRSKRESADIIQLDYRPHPIRLRATSSAERRWRVRACSKEPWTVAWVEDHIKEGDVLYDIGANVGAFSLIAAKHCAYQVTVVAFEPGYASFAHLCENIVLNQCERSIIPVPVPLSDVTGLAGFEYRSLEAGQSRHALTEAKLGGSRSGIGGRYCQPVLAMRLDDLLPQFGLPLPTHIKLDVDGAELRVLNGAGSILQQRQLLTILVEVSRSLADSLTGLLCEVGFSLSATHARKDKLNAPEYRLFVRH